MNEQDGPWLVDGITEAVRAAALDAAARNGVPLGVWIEAAIREFAAAPYGTPANATLHDEASILAAIDALAARIDAAEAATQQAITPLRDRLALLSAQIAGIERAIAAADDDRTARDAALSARR